MRCLQASGNAYKDQKCQLCTLTGGFIGNIALGIRKSRGSMQLLERVWSRDNRDGCYT